MIEANVKIYFKENSIKIEDINKEAIKLREHWKSITKNPISDFLYLAFLMNIPHTHVTNIECKTIIIDMNIADLKLELDSILEEVTLNVT